MEFRVVRTIGEILSNQGRRKEKPRSGSGHDEHSSYDFCIIHIRIIADTVPSSVLGTSLALSHAVTSPFLRQKQTWEGKLRSRDTGVGRGDFAQGKAQAVTMLTLLLGLVGTLHP